MILFLDRKLVVIVREIFMSFFFAVFTRVLDRDNLILMFFLIVFVGGLELF